ncbi:thiamine phosphate synthase [bacterium SCSIO 12696]|nr:thiamine phosphate synthase [bacterium SCSIO 12696]
MKAPRPIVWTIAGSDSGGGAGIQADLHSFQSLGVHGCSVITTITAQNSHCVAATESVSADTLRAQIQTLAHDLPPSVIKIGLLASKEQVAVVSEEINHLKSQIPGLRVVYDPVSIASSGSPLTVEPIEDSVRSQLMPMLDVITPNSLEAERVTGTAIVDYPSLRGAADHLQRLGAVSVVVKGGHSELIPGYCLDYLRSDIFESDATEMVLAQPRIDSPNHHGSGCCYASALAAALALDYSLEDAVVVANAYVHRGITESSALGQGPGPVAHGAWPESSQYFAQLVLPGSELAEQMKWTPETTYPATPFTPCDTKKLGLYPVVDNCHWLEKLLHEGVKTIQLRVKNLTGDALKKEVAQAVELGRQFNARLFINDYWQLAIELGAYGVHLGQEDMERADLRAIQNAGLRLGLSSHGYFELMRALAVQPSYVACGAIYPTTTKTMPSRPQGLVKLQRYLQLTGETPVVAIGGISCERARQVAATGVGSIAVVTAVTEAPDYRAAVADIQDILAVEYRP